MRQESTDGFHRDDIAIDLSAIEARRRAAVDRHHVVTEIRMIDQLDSLRIGVEPRHFVCNESSARGLRQRSEVDMNLIERIVPGDVTRQHPRIRCVCFPRDDCGTDAGRRRHGEPLQHLHMTVTTTNQHQFAYRRREGRRQGVFN